jgi:hypothetical protein
MSPFADANEPGHKSGRTLSDHRGEYVQQMASMTTEEYASMAHMFSTNQRTIAD